MRGYTLLLATALALPLAPMAHAEPAPAWPARPITLVVPFPPGGTTDLRERLAAQAAGRRLGQIAVVENRPGAGGGIGAASEARAQPDGYTLVMGTTGAKVTNQLIYKQVPYDPVRDCAPVTLVANS